MRWSNKKIEGVCSVEGCGKQLKAKGLCDSHYQMNRKFGRTEPILSKYSDGQKCSEIGCKNPIRAFGFCDKHYKAARREGRLHAGKYKRDHPLYSLWWARRQAKLLAPEWQDDFSRFITDVGERPGKFYTLITIHDGSFGPDNYRWREQIKRQKGETKKAFHARKWKAQVDARPAWNHQRDLVRKYKLTPERYQEMVVEQNGLCAICKRPETKIDHRLGTIKRLAVDHCHTSGKVRSLLCSICNQSIGQVGESVEILRAMIAYLETHSQPKESSP
jgi:hypothetical protein